MELKLKKHETLHSEENLVGYVRYSGGAIEVHPDYVVFYKNFLPFSWNVYGRSSIEIKYSDIGSVHHKGCGWFVGWFAFSFKYFCRPICFFFSKWFVWRRMRINKQIEPLYRYISERVLSYRQGLNTLSSDTAVPSQTMKTTIVETQKTPVCPKCGAPIDDEMLFCGECGEKLK